MAAAPAFAASTPQASNTAARGTGGAGYGYGYGMGTGGGSAMGMGLMSGYGPGQGAGDGTCANWAATAPQGTLTAQQKAVLARAAEQEKLAHDLYLAFAAKYPAPILERIAATETQHLSAVRTLLTRYTLADSTAGKADGQFAGADIQAEYNRLLTQGSSGRQAALTVAANLEQSTITELRQALTGLNAPDVQQVYQHLLNATQQHLAMFQSWAGQ
jgi:hypothetical protein